MDKRVILGENGDVLKGNHNKMAMLSTLLEGKEVIVLDGEKEYESLCNELGVKCIKVQSIDELEMRSHDISG